MKGFKLFSFTIAIMTFWPTQKAFSQEVRGLTHLELVSYVGSFKKFIISLEENFQLSKKSNIKTLNHRSIRPSSDNKKYDSRWLNDFIFKSSNEDEKVFQIKKALVGLSKEQYKKLKSQIRSYYRHPKTDFDKFLSIVEKSESYDEFIENAPCALGNPLF